ncbi:MAG: hypothetical protein KDI92_05790 [Xanthomonadales bacterium]|nr:hypothetical protein [Xanthomonadales bacterium]
MRKGILTFIFLIYGINVLGVNISTNGYGESIILPFYTVNNNLNTLITVNNSTDDVKALKLHFREGKEGKAVLSFNLYLAPQDIWTAGIVPTISTIPGHSGEASALFISVDTSCTPFLNPAGQQFLPYEIEAESDDTDLERSREGFIEIIEMGVVDINSELGQAATIPIGAGSPSNCAALDTAFSSGDWSGDGSQLHNAHIQHPSGGLSAEAVLIDVAEGVLFTVEGVAFEHFYPEESIYHTQPGETRVPSLAEADTVSLILHNGEMISSEWQNGYESISALLNKHQLETFYDLEPIVTGKTEVVLSFPTKRFYHDEVAPFGLVDPANNQAGCVTFEKVSYDRNSESSCDDIWGICFAKQQKLTPPPPPPNYQLCNNIHTFQHVELSAESNEQPTSILGSRFFDYRDVRSFNSGKLHLSFLQQSTSENQHVYTGLPVISMSFQKYTNAGAAEGLLAQYGGSKPAHFHRSISTD